MNKTLIFTLARIGAEREFEILQQRQRALEQAFPGIKESLQRSIVKARMEKARAARTINRRSRSKD